MMNQGDTVGKRKGAVVMATENGAQLPSGMLVLIGGTIDPATTSAVATRCGAV